MWLAMVDLGEPPKSKPVALPNPLSTMSEPESPASENMSLVWGDEDLSLKRQGPDVVLDVDVCADVEHRPGRVACRPADLVDLHSIRSVDREGGCELANLRQERRVCRDSLVDGCYGTVNAVVSPR